MISHFDGRELVLRALWSYSVARCRLTGLRPEFISYRKINSEYLVQIVIRPSRGSEPITYSGIGKSRVGFNKAFSELLEALSAQKLGIKWEIGRSGYACAPTLAEAHSRAYSELIERDSFLMHFICPDLTSIPLKPVVIESENVLSTALQSSYKSIFVCLSVIKKGNHWMVGLGTGDSCVNAASKARSEVIMISKSFHASGDPAKDKAYGLSEHYRASSEPEVQRRLAIILNGGEIVKNFFETKQDRSQIAEFERYASNRIVVRCIHKDLIPLTFGDNWRSQEAEILKLMSKRSLHSLPFILHPML